MPCSSQDAEGRSCEERSFVSDRDLCLNCKVKQAFFVACVHGREDEVSALLQSGAADVDEMSHRMSPIFVACRNGHEGVAKLLLDHGADVTLTDGQARTPLTMAAENKPKICRVLLDNGVGIEMRDGRGLTPLLSAVDANVWTRRIDTAEFLLDRGADVDSSSGHDGSTSLLMACRWYGSPDLTELLLSHGADTELADDEAKTPLVTACEWRFTGCEKIVELLLRAAEERGRLPSYD